MKNQRKWKALESKAETLGSPWVEGEEAPRREHYSLSSRSVPGAMPSTFFLIKIFILIPIVNIRCYISFGCTM